MTKKASKSPSKTSSKASSKSPSEVPSEVLPEVPKKRRGIVIGLIVIVIALAALNVWSYFTQSSEISNLQSQYDELVGIVNLEESAVLQLASFSDEAGASTYWDFSIQYAGYISINVESTSTNTYVRLSYNEYSVVYDETIPVGSGGTAVFPVLPSDAVRVVVGNTNTVDPVTVTVTITYHY